jgi:hypothetical protein
VPIVTVETKQYFLCVSLRYVIVSVSQNAFMVNLYVTGSDGTCLGCQVECPAFLSDFDQLWYFSTDVLKSHQGQISRTVQWVPR